MTKTELMENYTAEQLAEMVVNANIIIDGYRRSKNILKSERFNNEEVAFYETEAWTTYHENSKLQSEVEKYRKAFEDAKNERDYKIAEYQKKIEELTDEIDFLAKENILIRQDPIDIAKDMINAEGEYEHNPLVKKICGNDKGTYRIFDIGELRQIAEHLLVYCNHNGEDEE